MPCLTAFTWHHCVGLSTQLYNAKTNTNINKNINTEKNANTNKNTNTNVFWVMPCLSAFTWHHCLGLSLPDVCLLPTA